MTRRKIETLLDSLRQRQPMPMTRLLGADSKVLLEDLARRTLFTNTSAKTKQQEARAERNWRPTPDAQTGMDYDYPTKKTAQSLEGNAAASRKPKLYMKD